MKHASIKMLVDTQSNVLCHLLISSRSQPKLRSCEKIENFFGIRSAIGTHLASKNVTVHGVNMPILRCYGQFDWLFHQKILKIASLGSQNRS